MTKNSTTLVHITIATARTRLYRTRTSGPKLDIDWEGDGPKDRTRGVWILKQLTLQVSLEAMYTYSSDNHDLSRALRRILRYDASP
jgi:hypothetical protein